MLLKKNYKFMDDCPAQRPYWSVVDDNEERVKIIEKYWLKKSLSETVFGVDIISCQGKIKSKEKV